MWQSSYSFLPCNLMRCSIWTEGLHIIVSHSNKPWARKVWFSSLSPLEQCHIILGCCVVSYSTFHTNVGRVFIKSLEDHPLCYWKLAEIIPLYNLAVVLSKLKFHVCFCSRGRGEMTCWMDGRLWLIVVVTPVTGSVPGMSLHCAPSSWQDSDIMLWLSLFWWIWSDWSVWHPLSAQLSQNTRFSGARGTETFPELHCS